MTSGTSHLGPTPGTATERELVSKAVAGSRDAFEQLYRQNVGTVFGFVCNRIGHGPAEDVTAETFCRAFQHIGGYEDRGLPFRVWLLRIAYNLVVARSRRKGERTEPLEEPELLGTAGHEEDVVGKVSFEEVMDSFRRLSPPHQSVLDLRFLRELSVAEVGIVLELSDEAVRALTYRALRALQKIHLGTSGNGRPDRRDPMNAR